MRELGLRERAGHGRRQNAMGARRDAGLPLERGGQLIAEGVACAREQPAEIRDGRGGGLGFWRLRARGPGHQKLTPRPPPPLTFGQTRPPPPPTRAGSTPPPPARPFPPSRAWLP